VKSVTLGVEGYGIDMVPSLAMVTQSLGVALAIGILASLLPALAVARRPLWLGVKTE
jgi:hypothetical protein